MNPDWLTLLKNVPIFSTFGESQLSQILKRMKPTSLPKGAVLVEKNSAGDALYVIISGSIRLINDKKTLAFLDSGDAIGDMTLLAGEPYQHTATAETTVELLVLHKKDFDDLLDKQPAIGVMLSRVLSTQLASANKGGRKAEPDAKIYTVFPALPLRDQVVFSVNLGLALTEQTRRKTLLVMAGPAHELVTKSMGLEAPDLRSFFTKHGTLQEVEQLEQLVTVHPSGLEVLGLDEVSFYGPVSRSLYVFLQLIKDNYDFCILCVPPRENDTTAELIKESDRTLIVTGPQSLSEDLSSVRRMDQLTPSSKKLEKVWLSLDQQTLPREFIPDNRLAWDVELGKQFMNSGSPFIPSSFMVAQRMIDRLARSLGGLSVGFAMGSGAAFGYALIGMLRVLERNGIYPDVVSGTSMGALIGAFYASGRSPDELEQIAKSITRARLWSMMDFTIPRSGVFMGRGVLNFLRTHLDEKTFSDLQIPFACVATDINTGKEVVMNEGSVADAVRASLSLPFFFEPAYLNGRYLVDGGLVNPVPTSTVVTLGANIILSANLTSKTGERKLPRVMGWKKQLPAMLRGPAIPEILMKTIYTMQYEIAQARSEIADVVMNVSAGNFLWWDLHKADEIIRLGEARAEESLAKIKSLLPYFSDSCRVRLAHRGRKRF
jgi:NTE family protein